MRAVLSTLVMLAALSAAAMSIRTETETLATSADGKSALQRLDSSGPEGGGSVTYRVTGSEPRDFEISNDLSPGDGSRPQHISERVCRDRLAELMKLVAKRGIRGVSIDPKACASESREGAVAVGAR